MGLKGMLEWLGLANDSNRYHYDEDGYGEETSGIYTDYEYSEVTELTGRRRPRGQAQPVQTEDSIYAYDNAPKGPDAIKSADLDRIVKINPRTYNEARTIGENYRNNVPVIMNLSEMELEDAKRLIDFASGLVFGLDGTIERVTSKVFLLSPRNVAVADEDKQQIASDGFFNQS